MRAVIITGPNESDWQETDIPTDPAGGASLEALQKAVGGYIEALPIPREEATAYINDSGAIDDLPIYTLWTYEDGTVIEPLHGPIVILGPMVQPESGNEGALTDAALAYARKVIRPIRQRELKAIVSDGRPCPHCNGSGYRNTEDPVLDALTALYAEQSDVPLGGNAVRWWRAKERAEAILSAAGELRETE